MLSLSTNKKSNAVSSPTPSKRTSSFFRGRVYKVNAKVIYTAHKISVALAIISFIGLAAYITGMGMWLWSETVISNAVYGLLYGSFGLITVALALAIVDIVLIKKNSRVSAKISQMSATIPLCLFLALAIVSDLLLLIFYYGFITILQSYPWIVYVFFAIFIASILGLGIMASIIAGATTHTIVYGPREWGNTDYKALSSIHKYTICMAVFGCVGIALAIIGTAFGFSELMEILSYLLIASYALFIIVLALSIATMIKANKNFKITGTMKSRSAIITFAFFFAITVVGAIILGCAFIGQQPIDILLVVGVTISCFGILVDSVLSCVIAYGTRSDIVNYKGNEYWQVNKKGMYTICAICYKKSLPVAFFLSAGLTMLVLAFLYFGFNLLAPAVAAGGIGIAIAIACTIPTAIVAIVFFFKWSSNSGGRMALSITMAIVASFGGAVAGQTLYSMFKWGFAVDLYFAAVPPAAMYLFGLLIYSFFSAEHHYVTASGRAQGALVVGLLFGLVIGLLLGLLVGSISGYIGMGITIICYGFSAKLLTNCSYKDYKGFAAINDGIGICSAIFSGLSALFTLILIFIIIIVFAALGQMGSALSDAGGGYKVGDKVTTRSGEKLTMTGYGRAKDSKGNDVKVRYV